MPKALPAVRVPDQLASHVEQAAKDKGLSVSAWVREAIRAHLAAEARNGQLDSLEARLVATMNRMSREARTARNETQMVIAMLDTFARLYLLHTPPIPREAVRASAASADDRHEKFVAAFINSLQGNTGLLERLNGAFAPSAD